MAEMIEIKASGRQRAGTGAARAVRRQGMVPGIVYGAEKDAQNVAVDFNELRKLVQRGRFLSTVFSLSVDGAKERVLPREVQFDPIKDLPVHVDFQRIAADGRVRVGVPVKFFNEALSPGLKRGGVLNIVRHEIELWCPADSIPAFLEANLEGLEIGRSIHISAIKLPDGVRPTITDRDFTVATIAGAVALKPEEDEVTAAAPADGAAAADAAAAPGDAKGAAPAAKGAAAPAKGADAGKGDKKR